MSSVHRSELSRRVRWSFVTTVEHTAAGYRIVDRGWLPMYVLMFVFGYIPIFIAGIGITALIVAFTLYGFLRMMGGPVVVGAMFVLSQIPLVAAITWGIRQSKAERSIEMDATTGRATVTMPGGRHETVEADRLFLTPCLLVVHGGGASMVEHHALVLRAGSHRFLVYCEPVKPAGFAAQIAFERGVHEHIDNVRQSLPARLRSLPATERDKFLTVGSLAF